MIPSLLGEHSLELVHRSPLQSLPHLSDATGVALVRAARLYQSAVWIADADPNQTWILLASAVETAAAHWSESANTPLESLHAWHPSLGKLLLKKGSLGLANEVAEKLSKISGATWKFLQFLNRFRPEPPEKRPPSFYQVDWETAEFEQAMRKVYSYRSRALHGGTPFPAPMCWEPMTVGTCPMEAFPGGAGTGIHSWQKADLPLTLHLFEYIVRNALLNWWKSSAGVRHRYPAPDGDRWEVGTKKL